MIRAKLRYENLMLLKDMRKFSCNCAVMIVVVQSTLRELGKSVPMEFVIVLFRYLLCSDEGGRILVVSFYECPEYVSRISIVMPCDFRVWTPSWTGWPTGTSPRSDVIVNLPCLDIGFVSQCRHAQMKAVKNPHIRGTQRQFSENICSEDDFRSRIFETFVIKFLAFLPVLGFSNI